MPNETQPLVPSQEQHQDSAVSPAPGDAVRDATPQFDSTAFATEVSAAVAKQLKDFQTNMESRLAPKPVKKQPEDEVDWENDFYVDPKATMTKFAKQIREEITQELTNQYQADRNITDFWSGFYSDNEHLKEHDAIVRAILDSKEGAWRKEGITVQEAYKRLGDMTDAIGGKLGRKKAAESQEYTTDGLAFIQQPAKPDTNEKVRTLSDAIRDRQAKFRKA